MESRIRLYLYTFLGVGLTVFIIGFFGINISLKYIQRNYIQLQIDVNKRQAERMAHTIKSEIKMGIPLDSIRSAFQSSIQGTEFDKGFLCMYDTRLNQLVCHPDVNAIGVSFNKDFVFRYQNSNANVYITDVYGKKKPAGGIFVQGKIRTDIIYTVPIEGTNWFVNAHENINAISEEIKRLRFVYILGSLIFGLIISIAASMTARRISRNYEKRIEQKNVELQALNYKINLQKDEISSQLNEIEKKSKEITDSINYAEKIQSALLPPLTLIKSYFPESFVLYKPKAIVSGDFYWSCRISNRILVGVFDCTGHGVPGAFMSMLGITLLNETVIREGIDAPHLIFNQLSEKIIQALGQRLRSRTRRSRRASAWRNASGRRAGGPRGTAQPEVRGGVPAVGGQTRGEAGPLVKDPRKRVVPAQAGCWGMWARGHFQELRRRRPRADGYYTVAWRRGVRACIKPATVRERPSWR